MKRETGNILAVAREVCSSGDYSKMGTKTLEALFSKYIEAYLRNMPFLFMFWNVENLVVSQLEGADLPRFFKGREIWRALGLLLVPSRKSYTAKERGSLEQIAREVAKEPELKKCFIETPVGKLQRALDKHPKAKDKIENHLKRFAFIGTAFHLNKPLSMRMALGRIKEALLENPLEKQKTEKPSEYRKCIKRLEGSPEVLERVRLLQEMLFWKNERLGVLFLCDYKARGLFLEIANRMGLSYMDFVFLRLGEIEEWFRSGTLPVSKETVKKRQKGYKLEVKKGNAAITTKFSILRKAGPPEKTLQLEGRTANPGVARGRVKVVFGLGDIAKVKRGDILVTTMARPAMIMAMERASAFVTDKGGRLCHAAIVARELNKPCVVGTNTATRLLMDNDCVEVDAGRGLVRKISA
jgi:phosphohistidine swiveling domain-containing protein